MIGQLRGYIIYKWDQGIVLDVNGVGYELYMPESNLASISLDKDEIVLFTHLVFKEDSVSLFGFLNRFDRDIFRLLLEVSGVGPKLALNLLSRLSGMELLKVLAKEDIKRLQSIHGVGKKTAARLCVDLKEQAKKFLKIKEKADIGIESLSVNNKTRNQLIDDAVSALLNLGYTYKEAMDAINAIGTDIVSKSNLKQLITYALKCLSNKE